MKKSNPIRTLSGILWALTFGVFLLWGTLLSSDFPRGFYLIPEIPDDSSVYSDIKDLKANLLFNNRNVWAGEGTDGLQDYLDVLDRYDLEAILRHGDWHNPGSPNHTDSIPTLVEYYSYGNYNQLQVEWNYENALWHLNNDYGSGYYYFLHQSGATVVDFEDAVGKVVKCEATGGESRFIKGLYLTIGKTDTSDQLIHQEPRFDEAVGEEGWLFGYAADADSGRYFINRFRIAIDTADFGVELTDTVFHYKMTMTGMSSDFSYHKYITVGDFDANYTLQEFAIDSAFADEDYFGIQPQLFNSGPVDVYVDWVEYMDREQGYYLWWDDDTTAATLQRIAEECKTMMDYDNGDHIAGWGQGDEPHRCFFESHGKICDYFTGHDTLDGYWPQAVINASWNKRRPDHFVRSGRPKIFEVNLFVFDSTGTLGMQSELDTLISYLEWTYQACGDTIPVHFLGQCYGYHEGYSGTRRNPTRSEIFAEAYIALAHGAKGINFYRYISSIERDGLVDLNYEHNDPPFAEKWQAVQDVFTQLDSIGPTLLSLDRTAAYCVYPTPDYQSPITNIEFMESGTDYIEVGQFDSIGVEDTVKYVIVVNRKTDEDRHIDIFTTLRQDSTGDALLWDVYTQEKFISSTGNFRAIPFDSGQGRVFRLSRYNFPMNGGKMEWPTDNHHVLADSFWTTMEDTLWIFPGTTIRATSYGRLYIIGGLNSGIEPSGGEVVFKSLEQGQSNRWRGILISNNCYQCHDNASRCSKFYNARIQGATVGIDIRSSSWPVEIHDSFIEDSCTFGIKCDDSDLECDSTHINFCNITGGAGIWLYECDGEFRNCEIDSVGFFGNYHAMYLNDSDAEIGRCGFSGNSCGVYCTEGSEPILFYHETNYPNCGRNKFHYNDYGVKATGNSWPILGKGANRQGLNSFIGNSEYAVYESNSGSDTLWAQYNWWGTTDSDSIADMVYGTVVYRPYLESAPESVGGGWFAGKGNQGGTCGDPGSSLASGAQYLNEIGTELYLDKDYQAAIDTFSVVINNYPNDPSAQYALGFIDNCYRRMKDYSGAVNYLSSCAAQLTGTALASQPEYKSIYHLKKAGFGEEAYALATNTGLLTNLSQGQQEHAMIESGLIKKYYLHDQAVADSIFMAFLEMYPASELALIAATELGVELPRTTTAGMASATMGISALPQEYSLYQNYPNPFNSQTTIRYDLPEISEVTLKIYNIMGRKVATLVDRKETAGYKRVSWSGSNRYGGELSSGMYILQMVAKGESGRKFVRVKKLLLLK